MLSKAAVSFAPRLLSKGHFSTSSAILLPQDWKGTSPKEHINEKNEDLDVQSASAKGGKESKAKGSMDSSATQEKDIGNSNAQAKKDTKAPGPVIGMNDERGAKGTS